MNRTMRFCAYNLATAAVIAAFCLGAMALAGKFNGPTRVLVCGDSISLGYTLHLAKALGPRYRVTHTPGNARALPNILAHADEWILAEPSDVLILNAGLHDTRANNARTLPDYEPNLRRLFALIRARCPRTRIIWITTTPVDEARMTIYGPNAAVDSLNSLATPIARSYGATVVDLNAVFRGRMRGAISHDGTHLSSDGYAECATLLAREIRPLPHTN